MHRSAKDHHSVEFSAVFCLLRSPTHLCSSCSAAESSAPAPSRSPILFAAESELQQQHSGSAH